MSNVTCVESKANKRDKKIFLFTIKFGKCEIRRWKEENVDGWQQSLEVTIVVTVVFDSLGKNIIEIFFVDVQFSISHASFFVLNFIFNYLVAFWYYKISSETLNP